MLRSRTLPMVLIIAVGCLSLTGCSMIESATCVDWVSFDTPAKAAKDADAIIIGTPAKRTGSTSLFGYDVPVWSITVDRWVKGDGGKSVEVAPAPQTCEPGEPLPTGDPLDTNRKVILFLHKDGTQWRTLTPYQGIIPAPADGQLPAEWP